MIAKGKKIVFLMSILIGYQPLLGQVQIRAEQRDDAPQISKHIYGHFAEHLGRCIYDGLYVGTQSEVPNTHGIRNDIIAALKALKIPNLRWPGGCFADTYHWKDGIGPRENRPTIVNTWWGGVTEDNSFGTHDFLNLCEILDTEPYLSGNVGSGTVQELADWVQYSNFKGTSPMSDLRRKNGREYPWTVKYWGVGNEAWGCGGHMRPEYYVDVYRKYATFMSDADVEGGLYKIASGASDADYNWTEVLMKNIPHHMLQGVALHHYSVIDWQDKGPDVGFTESHYFASMKEALLMDELIQKHTAIMDQYDADKKVDLIVDEWGGWYNVQEGTNPGFLFQQNTMRDAMIAGVTLNIFNNHAARVKMANLAQTVNVLQAPILTEGDKIVLTPTYHVMRMYRVHQDAQLIPLTYQSPKYSLRDGVLPAISVSASKDREGVVHISLVNIDANQEHGVAVYLNQMGVKAVAATLLTSKNLQDYNSFELPNRIVPERFTDFTTHNGILEVELPPFSVLLIECR